MPSNVIYITQRSKYLGFLMSMLHIFHVELYRKPMCLLQYFTRVQFQHRSEQNCVNLSWQNVRSVHAIGAHFNGNSLVGHQTAVMTGQTVTGQTSASVLTILGRNQSALGIIQSALRLKELAPLPHMHTNTHLTPLPPLG